jgi:hypothetical protein
MKRRTISFIEAVNWPPLIPHKPTLPPPTPASKHVPEWYAKSERWLGPANRPEIVPGGANQGLKLCVPFLDGMTSGYMIELHTDVEVKPSKEDDSVVFDWLSFPQVMVTRDERLGEKIPRPAGHLKYHFAWVGHWGIKVPKGYSVLLTHPLNRFDLPFTTLSGLMDSDEYFAPGNIPFFLKEGFQGVIPAGTPIAQIIPIKREEWVSKTASEKDKAITSQQSYDSRRVLEGHYKKNFWKRKKYE